MKIDRVELRIAAMPLRHEFETSSHRKRLLEHIIVTVTDADGVVGRGECASPSGPFYCGETTESCWAVLRDYLVPIVVGAQWERPEEITRLLDAVAGNRFAKAGLEAACWDLAAQRAGVSLASALGGTASRIEAGVSLGIEPTIDALLGQVEHHLAEGYRRVKLKVRPGWDLEPARAVRQAHPDLLLQVDANTAYTGDDIPRLVALEPLGLAMIEQPFAEDDFVTHAELAAALETPVCLDESITSIGALETALRLEACDIVNIKVSRLGGLAPARAVHDRLLAAGVPAWCGGMHEFGVGRAANLAIASLPGFVLPSDVSASAKYYERDIIDPPITASGGWVAVPTAPGIGVHVDLPYLAERSTRVLSITADGVAA